MNGPVARTVIETPAGPLFIEVNDAHITRATFLDEVRAEHAAYLSQSTDKITGRLRDAVAAYFGGNLTALDDLEVLPHGTPFQGRVWRALRQVGAGSVTSYGELSRAAEAPGAARAVGNACGRNPIVLFVPCHRVLAAGGRIGGFSGGLWRKEILLAHEGIHPKANRRPDPGPKEGRETFTDTARPGA